MTEHYQGYQGDVGIVEITKDFWPKNARLIASGKYELAKGESTGHCHVLEGNVKIYETQTDGGVERWLKVGPKGATVRHTSPDPDHSVITIPLGRSGLYSQRGIYEWTDADERRIVD